MNKINSILNKNNVFFYYANIIDYLRFILLIIGIFYSFTHPLLFVSLYFISFILDLFDGLVARYFNQCSLFGSSLDMIIDRISTSSFLVILSHLYKERTIIYILLMVLDISSHWLQVYSSILELSKNKNIKNHKELKEYFKILSFYYNNKIFLGILCFGAEMFLVLRYLKYFFNFEHNSNAYNKNFLKLIYITDTYIYFLFYALYIFKQIMSILQIISASLRIVDYDIKLKDIDNNKYK